MAVQINEYTDTDGFYPPASTLKLVTVALAAKLELGDDFHYTTNITRSNEDVVISFSGDPTLQREHLKAFYLNTLKSQSKPSKVTYTSITRLIQAISEQLKLALGHSIGVCYSAPFSSMTLDSNCAQASIYTKDNGSTRIYSWLTTR